VAVGGDPADAVGGGLGEPERIVRPGDDDRRPAAGIEPVAGGFTAGSNRPISPLWTIVNHSAPSGPLVTAYGPLSASATTYSWMTTAGMRCAPVRRSDRWNIMMAS
jgi:hypothetical protein